MADYQEVVIKAEPTGMEAPVVPPKEDENKPVEETPEGQEQAPEEKPEEAPEEKPEEAPEETPEETPEDKAAEEAAEAAGIDIPAVEAHFLETGEIPADTYEKAAKIGVSKEMVDEFVQFRVGQADRVRTEMLQPYGGEDTVGGMVDWAGKNWSPEQAKSFNEAVNSGDRGRVDLALKALQADFNKKNGVKPNLLKPSGGNAVPGGIYESMAQLVKDQQNPLYRTDEAFRANVIAKLSRSKI